MVGFSSNALFDNHFLVCFRAFFWVCFRVCFAFRVRFAFRVGLCICFQMRFRVFFPALFLSVLSSVFANVSSSAILEYDPEYIQSTEDYKALSSTVAERALRRCLAPWSMLCSCFGSLLFSIFQNMSRAFPSRILCKFGDHNLYFAFRRRPMFEIMFPNKISNFVPKNCSPMYSESKDVSHCHLSDKGVCLNFGVAPIPSSNTHILP